MYSPECEYKALRTSTKHEFRYMKIAFSKYKYKYKNEYKVMSTKNVLQYEQLD